MSLCTTVDINQIPRGERYKDKIIKTQDFIKVRNTVYYKRHFTDDSVELVRYDLLAKRWVVLYFIGSE